MNKRNSLFSPSAYLESLRQTRLTGLIYLVCCLLFSFLPALISSVSGSSFAPNLADYADVLFAYMYLAPLTLVLSSFGFLTAAHRIFITHCPYAGARCMSAACWQF